MALPPPLPGHPQWNAVSRYPMNNSEGEFQPGSGDLVLRNLVGIASPQDMDELAGPRTCAG